MTDPREKDDDQKNHPILNRVGIVPSPNQEPAPPYGDEDPDAHPKLTAWQRAVDYYNAAVKPTEGTSLSLPHITPTSAEEEKSLSGTDADKNSYTLHLNGQVDIQFGDKKNEASCQAAANHAVKMYLLYMLGPEANWTTDKIKSLNFKLFGGPNIQYMMSKALRDIVGEYFRETDTTVNEIMRGKEGYLALKPADYDDQFKAEKKSSSGSDQKGKGSASHKTGPENAAHLQPGDKNLLPKGSFL